MCLRSRYSSALLLPGSCGREDLTVSPARQTGPAVPVAVVSVQLKPVLLFEEYVSANRFSRRSYEGGAARNPQELDADRNLFDAKLVRARIQRGEWHLYRALGGE